MTLFGKSNFKKLHPLWLDVYAEDGIAQQTDIVGLVDMPANHTDVSDLRLRSVPNWYVILKTSHGKLPYRYASYSCLSCPSVRRQSISPSIGPKWDCGRTFVQMLTLILKQ